MNRRTNIVDNKVKYNLIDEKDIISELQFPSIDNNYSFVDFNLY